MNKAEREICNRVRFIRGSIKWSQANLSKTLGITRNVFAAIEYARTPLRFGVGIRLAALTGFSPRWIVTGVEPQKEPFNINENSLSGIPKNCLFSIAWQDWLPQLISNKTDAAESVGAEDVLDYLSEDFRGIAKRLPPNLLQSFYAHITNAGRDFFNANLIEINAWEARQKKPTKRQLTDSATSDLLAEVKAQLPTLLERLKRATSKSGKMSALADYLKVPLASVSRWLSGKREPSGEITLKMLRWVEQQERQK